MPRPLSVTGLALALGCLAAFNALGALTAYRELAFLRDLPLTASPLYLVVSRAGWAVVLIGLAGGLWRLKQWGRVGTLAALTLYVAQVWLERWLFDRTDFSRATLPYLSVASIITLAGVWGLLCRRTARRSFTG